MLDRALGSGLSVEYNISPSSPTDYYSFDLNEIIDTNDPLLNCPTTYELEVTMSNGSTLDPEFTFDASTNVFGILSNNASRAGPYAFTVNVKYAGTGYAFATGGGFSVELLACDSAVITYPPGQPTTTTPPEYEYSGTASFTLLPFTVTPPTCILVYECSSSGHAQDLCSYSTGNGSTDTEFKSTNGYYEITSVDN